MGFECCKGLSADSEEKHEPAGDIDTVVVDSLKALDPERPIREADIPPHFEMTKRPLAVAACYLWQSDLRR